MSLLKLFSFMAIVGGIMAIVLLISTDGAARIATHLNLGPNAPSLVHATEPGQPPQSDIQSERAPDFRVTEINGRAISLASLKGKIVIVDFWATWCPPCRLEVPIFNELKKKYQGRNLEIVAVSLDDSADEVRKFLRRTPLNYTVVHGDEAIISQFGEIAALPTTFFLDREGNIRKKHIGFMDQTAFEEEIHGLLSE